MDRPSKELVAHTEWHYDKVSASITLGGQVYPVSFAASEDFGSDVDFLLPLALLPALVTRSSLKLPGVISPRLLSAVPKIQDIFLLWGREQWGERFQRVPVDVEVRKGPVARASGVGCFFSGGIDSFYTLLKHREEVTHIIFVHGFDIALEDRALREQASRMAREVARELGKSLIEVETNLRSFPRRVGWRKYHGAALASVALLFQHKFRKILIPSSFSYLFVLPWGSHPLLDPLWSTELTEFEHDGCEATRVDKAVYLSEHELPMEWLRVCYENPNSAYNCGRCTKCTITMVNLRAAQALERCKTLPNEIDLRTVADMRFDYTMNLEQNLRALERLGTEPELAQALAEAIDKCRPGWEELEHLRGQLAILNSRYSSQRYKLADTIYDGALQIRKIRQLVRRKGSTTC